MAMHFQLDKSWKVKLEEEFEKNYFKELISFVEGEYENNICFPPIEEIFNAFNHCHFDDVKVVIIGQDPYHGKGQANGLCFSVNDEISHPPSLRNIFKELQSDIGGDYPISGNLRHWANSGVLLLNATLTVRESIAGSHQKKGWEIFTDKVIELISSQKENVIFLLWGGYAKKKKKLINKKEHVIMEAGHPSPLSANRGYWFGNKHFSVVNEALNSKNLTSISWLKTNAN